MVWRAFVIALAAFVSAVEKPSQDPFYIPPAGFRTKAPGTILRTRQVANINQNTFPTVPINISATYQTLFRSTDVYGRPTAGVNTIIVPATNPNPEVILSYQFPYDSPDKDCSPSYTLQTGFVASPVDKSPSPLILLILAALERGWYINVPDHEGLNASLGVGLVNGQVALDSMRAAINSGSTTGISPNAKVAAWGYSGGAFATEYASELQSVYAPELNLVAAAVGGIDPNAPAAVATSIKRGHNTGLLVDQMLGAANSYTNMSNYLNAQLIPKTANYFRTGLYNCSSAAVFNKLTVGEFFMHSNTATTAAVPASIFQWSGTLGVHGIVKAPLYIYQAINDGLTAIGDVDAFDTKYCNAGAHVTYLRDESNTHVPEGIVGSGGAYQWIIDRFNGVALPKACNTTTINMTTLAPSDETLFGKPIFEQLQSSYVSAGGKALPTSTSTATATANAAKVTG